MRTDPFTFRFSTKYQDDETDLLYYGYRYYSPSAGRWLSRDPLGERGFRTMPRMLRGASEGEYLFTANNPVNLTDGLGLKAESPTGNCKDPCRWARDRAKKDNPSADGITVCCNGKKYGCVLKPGHATHPGAQGIISGCIQAHEDYHVSDPMVICERCSSRPTYATYNKGWELRHTECEAWSVTLMCLSSRKYLCGGDAFCEAQVDAEIKTAEGQIEKYCSP